MKISSNFVVFLEKINFTIMALDTTPFTPGVRKGSSPLGNFARCDLVECSVHHPLEALALTKALVNVTE